MEFIYKGLEAVYERHLVTDEEIDRHLERMQQQIPKIKVINDRPAQNGDELVLDYAGFCDGEQFAGGTAQYQTLTLGSGMFIPGFEEQLVGCNAGDDVTVRVTFPEQYHAENLAGKEAEFRCTVHEIRERGTYTMGDEFAQYLGVDTYEQLRVQVGESMQQYTDARGLLDLEDQLIRRAAATFDFQPDEKQIDEAVEDQINALKAQLAQQGLNIEMYTQFTGKSLDEIREDNRAEAEQNLRIRTAAEQIAKLENLEVTEEDMAEAYKDVCRQNGIEMEQLQEMCDEAFTEAMELNVKIRKAMMFVRENAVLTEKTV